MMKSLFTTAEIAETSGLSQRVVQKRIKRLKIQPQRVGVAFLLNVAQAERVRQDDRSAGRPRKPNKNGNGK